MRIYRDTYKDRKTGERRKTLKWYIDLVDHNGIRHRIPGFTAKRQTKTLADNIEGLVSSKIAGQRPDIELQRWLEGIPASMIYKFVAWGLVDADRAEGGKPLTEHLKDFKKALLSDGATIHHANTTRNRVQKVFEGCGFVTWTDVQASRVQQCISDMRNKKGMAAKTAKDYLQAVRQFGRWMVQDRRASESPVAHLKPVTVTKSDQEQRRALEPNEIRRLLETTEASQVSYGMTCNDVSYCIV